MSEIRCDMKVVLVDMICKECNWGRLRPTGVTLMSYPAQYPRKCDRCGATETYFETYPRTVMEPL